MNLYYIQADGDTFVRHIHNVEPTHWGENNVCYAEELTPEQAAHFGVHQLKLITPPHYDPVTQICEHMPALLIDGAWTQNYKVSDIDPAAASAAVEAKWAAIRSDRNNRLDGCDWTQLPDAPADAAVWAVYRQALRDITTQADPFAIVWPESPTS